MLKVFLFVALFFGSVLAEANGFQTIENPSFESSELAQKGWFNLQADCYIEQGRIAYCQACNSQFRPIFCRGRIEGRTYYGSWLSAQGGQWVRPGQCMTGHVYARNPIYDPLVYARADIYCRY